MDHSHLHWRRLAVAVAGLLACQSSDSATAPSAPDALRVRLHYVGGRGSASLRVTARAGTISESAIVGSSNAVVLGSGLGLEDSVEIRVEETGTSARFHPAIAIVTGANVRTAQQFVLIPRRWTIAAAATPCRYSGQIVGIDLDLAYTRSVADPSSFYWRTPNAGGGWTYRTATFPKSALPIPVAFDRATATEPISTADSMAFWNTVGELESELCENVFGAATMTAVTPARGVAVSIDRDLDATARGGPVRRDDQGVGSLVGGVMVCRATTCLTSGEVVRHELLHVLGFGHSCAWPTIMRAGCTGSPRASAQDVAYYQLYYAARAIQVATGAQHSLAAAHQGGRVIIRGLPIEPVS